jgi:hypothetical protein
MKDAKVSIVNHATGVSPSDCTRLLKALQKQVDEHFAPVWGVRADLSLAEAAAPAPGSWWLVILDNSDQAGALGYHDVTDEGLPVGKVFVKTAAAANRGWTVTASHELLEMLADPDINLAITVPRDNGQMILYAYEVCDPCQAFSYEIDGVAVSDFVYPEWFESFRQPSNNHFDRLKKISWSLQLAAGGYANTFDIAAGFGWQQIEADGTPAPVVHRAPPGSRRARRRLHRSLWQPSLTAHQSRHLVATKPLMASVTDGASRAMPAAATHATAAAGEPTIAAPTVVETYAGNQLALRSAARPHFVIDDIVRALKGIEQGAQGNRSDADNELLGSALLAAAQQVAGGNFMLPGEFPHEAESSLVLSALGEALEKAGLIGAEDIAGIGQYETFDARWLESLRNYLPSLTKRVSPFPIRTGANAAPIAIGDGPVKIAIIGDWGTNNSAAKNVAQAVAKVIKPDYAIHLGDVYYSGLIPEERENFLNLWPFKDLPGRSFALNSNHEMYAGGAGYFGIVLKAPAFSAQGGISYFALTNTHWLIIGLDTAYFSHSFTYQKGTLAGLDFEEHARAQVDWLAGLLHDPVHAAKNVILMTHHDGFDVNFDSRTLEYKQPLWDEVLALMGQRTLPANQPRRFWWYWGHVHAGLVYAPVAAQARLSGVPVAITVNARCIGHGGIPYKPFPANYQNVAFANGVRVVWAETQPASDPEVVGRALNGWALLTFEGDRMTEELFDESGSKRWPLP